jgi:putative phosphoesterase
MKIAIISDIHDNIENLKIALNWINKNKIKHLICCGDVTNNETLEFLASHFLDRIYLVKGNCVLFDEGRVNNFKNIEYFGKIGRFKLAGKFIGMCHEPFFRDAVLNLGKCDMIFYGHTHKPWEEEYQGVRTINPGTLGGVFLKGTFAVWDIESGEMELKILSKIL